MTWRRSRVVAAVIPAVIAVTAVVGGNWWHNRPPYGPEVLRIESSLNFVSYVDAQAALGDGVGAPPPSEGDQLVLARVSWQTPPEPLDRGWFSFFLIDKRTNLKPGNVSASAPRQLSVSVGGDGVDNKIAERYPWLRGAGDVRLRNGTWVSTGEQVAVFDETCLASGIRRPLPASG